jgi:hemolysin III
MESTTPEKPLLRGVFHLGAAVFSLAGGSVLVAMSRSAEAAVAAAIYATSLLAQFTVSGFYHRIQWTPRARAFMRRADHSAIFLLIAGTYTPITVLALSEQDGRRLLITIWIGAAAGVLMSLFWVTAPKALVAVLAIALGWTLVPYFSETRRLLGGDIWLILAGGLAYTFGAVVYAVKRPNPWPRVFGYHEIFHVLTIVGAVLHFVVVLNVVRAAV